MTTKVLIVDPDIAFAVGVKRALEQSGDYKVTAFANGQAAVELARVEPQDVTIIDFNLGDMDIAALIAGLRGVQPDLFILVSPRTGVQIERLQSLDVQGSITKPYYARQLGPVIREAVAARARLARKSKATAPPAPPLPNPPSTTPQVSKPASAPIPALSPDFDAALAELSKQPIIVEPPVQADDTFRRHIAAMLPEKPATPAGLRKTLESVVLSDKPFSEEATIADMVTGKPLIDPPLLPIPPAPLNKISEPPAEPDFATAALNAVRATPNQDFSLKTFVEKIEKETGTPLPGWARSSPEELDQPTLVEPAFVEAALSEPTPPAELKPETLVEPIPEKTEKTPEAAPEPFAEVALSLTQLSMHSAARVTILTRNDEAVAVAGELSERAVAGIVETIREAWKGSTDAGGALIRYIQVPGIGDFMLYSTQTVADMRLSMLFPAETSLRIIRKQTRQLLDALENPAAAPSAPTAEAQAETTLLSRPTDLRPPEGLQEAIESSMPPAAIEPVPPRAVGPLAPYAFVWLPQKGTLSPDLAGLMISWLNEIATLHGWKIEATEVQPAHVSLQINIPANEVPSSAVEALMRETAARADMPQLWADAYYIVPSDRPVTQQEIAHFALYRQTAEAAD